MNNLTNDELDILEYNISNLSPMFFIQLNIGLKADIKMKAFRKFLLYGYFILTDANNNLIIYNEDITDLIIESNLLSLTHAGMDRLKQYRVIKYSNNNPFCLL